MKPGTRYAVRHNGHMRIAVVRERVGGEEGVPIRWFDTGERACIPIETFRRTFKEVIGSGETSMPIGALSHEKQST